jgi:hypothetical protein
MGFLGRVAERTGLEPATPGVTGRYSNQLNYRSAVSRPWGQEAGYSIGFCWAVKAFLAYPLQSKRLGGRCL